MIDKIKISDWVNQQLANGKFSFTLPCMQASNPEKSDISIKLALKRLVDKNKIISINKGFYIIIPPAYSNMGLLPPTMFMDDLMEYLGRPYYISLLSAAALHGAAHQQPQVNFVCTSLPSMRTTTKKGMQIEYISKRNFPESHIIQKNTESGYVKVSDPLLTCLDLISYYKTVGGFNRVATIINELSEEINTNDIASSIIQLAPGANIQRLGYLWEYECEQAALADELFNLLKKSSTSLKTYKLNSSKYLQKENIKNRWKINVNSKIEIDE